jgi:hypothetical protein
MNFSCEAEVFQLPNIGNTCSLAAILIRHTMPTKTYFDFSEVEQGIKQNVPPLVYKYRTWTNDNHKNVLIQNQLWFSHPFDLNDPFDVRPDLVYDVAEIESDAFYHKLLNTIPHEYSHLSNKEKAELAQRQWQKIKSNPNGHLNANRQEILKRERFNQYGVFSTSSDCMNIPTWELYGDNHKGYAIGFYTLELIRQLQCTTGVVTYSDDPFPYSFLGKHEEVDILLYKKTSWFYEQEFRFITLGIGIYTGRFATVTPDTVAEWYWAIKFLLIVKRTY